jgi:hypothetical protein
MAGTFATADINHDGEVDILTLWYTNGDLRSEDMWIFSWNGKRGRIINSHDEWGTSVIAGSAFELLSTKKDGMKEIRGRNVSFDSDSTAHSVDRIYKWNGRLYIPSK